MSTPVNRRIFGGALLTGAGVLAVQRMRSVGLVPDRRKPRSRVAIVKATSYSGQLDRVLTEAVGLFDLDSRPQCATSYSSASMRWRRRSALLRTSLKQGADGGARG